MVYQRMKAKTKFQKFSCRFFKVIISTDLTAMRIPPAFSKKLERIESKEEAILTSSEGPWIVKIGKCQKGSSFYFKQGWEEFGKHHKLGIGDFVVFEHNGNLHFDVFVFDPTSCEKEFPTSNCRKNNIETAKKRMSLEPHGLAEVACKNPHFIGTAKYYHGRQPHMAIPKDFVISNDIGKVEIVCLRDSSQRLWPVKINSTKSGGGHSGTTMGLGWSKFYDAHELEDGDICLFELDPNYNQSSSSRKTRVIMDVIIFKTMIKRRMSSFNSSGTMPPEVAEACNACKNPHFIGKVPGFKYRMHILRDFLISNDIGKVTSLNLRDSRGRMWPVKLNYTKHFTCMGRGWSEFYSAHALEEGDVCLFELDSNYIQSISSEDTPMIMDVIIFSSSI